MSKQQQSLFGRQRRKKGATLKDGPSRTRPLYETGDDNQPRFGLKRTKVVLKVGSLQQIHKSGLYERSPENVWVTREMLAVHLGLMDGQYSFVEQAVKLGAVAPEDVLLDMKVGSLARLEREVLGPLRKYWINHGVDGIPCFFKAIPIYDIVVDPRDGHTKLLCSPVKPLTLIPMDFHAVTRRWKFPDQEIKDMAIQAAWIIAGMLVRKNSGWKEKAARHLLGGWYDPIRSDLLPFFEGVVERRLLAKGE